jgi:predicted nucleotidyltransferase
MIAPAENKATMIKRILEAKQKLASLGVVTIGLFGSFMRKGFIFGEGGS